ncbi:acyl-CoA dehydrogenase family protein [Dankookia sp. P2]|uniref:acyl-CoA dehydrogenase family protein n=1 Tax=Dankookia sp. P2 TaxID=3423955 RepID=UPI003D66A46B
MDFDLTDDQRLLGDSVTKLLSAEYGFEQRKALLKTPTGWSETLWQRYAELGLLGLPIAEDHGGFGGGPVDVMLLMQAFGRHLVLEPYLATVVLGATALRLAGNDAQQGEILPEVAAGTMKLAFAHYERQARYDLTDILTTATPKDGGFVLEGAKSVVLHGDCADRLIVSARTSGGRDDAGGSRSSWWMGTRPASPAAAMRCATARGRRRSPSAACRCRGRRCWAKSTTPCPPFSAWSRPASPPPAPR